MNARAPAGAGDVEHGTVASTAPEGWTLPLDDRVVVVLCTTVVVVTPGAHSPREGRQ